MSKKETMICEGKSPDEIDIEDVLIWLEDHFDDPYCEDVYELLDEMDDENHFDAIIHLTPKDAYEWLVDQYDGVYAPINIRIK